MEDSMPSYHPPASSSVTTMHAILAKLGYEPPLPKQLSLLDEDKPKTSDVPLWYAGNLDILSPRAVSVVGSRDVSDEGAKNAREVARELAQSEVVVVSGLAAGVDTHALCSAIDCGGKVVAVIGTPLDCAMPSSNAVLQEAIYRDQLLISQFPAGSAVRKWHFPARNRTMAALSAGTLIVEASDTSGTLHQAAECVRMNRWLFVMRSTMRDERLQWPKKYSASYDRFVVIDSTDEILVRI